MNGRGEPTCRVAGITIVAQVVGVGVGAVPWLILSDVCASSVHTPCEDCVEVVPRAS